MPGYKKTLVGVIPKDWEVTSLGAHGETYGGLTGKTKKDFGSGTARYVTFMDVMSNVVIDRHEFERVHVAPSESQNLVQSYDLLFNGSSETPEEVALCALVLHGTSHLYLNSFCFGYRLRTDRSVDPLFLAYLFRGSTGRNLVKALAQGSTRYNISKGALLAASLALPTLPEQRAIAAALSDVDALLEGLDRLIAKKRDLKQAAMQQLLTAQIRLPGFRKQWAIKRLGELGWTYGGLTGKSKADFGSGNAKYVTFMNVMTNTVIDCCMFEPVYVSPSEDQNRVARGDLLFNGSSETPQDVALCAIVATEVQDLFLNSFCFGFRPYSDTEVHGLFLTYYIRSGAGREILKSLAQGSTRYNLSKKALLEAVIRLPSLPEQSEIAGVLADMDAEIAALEAQREKIRDLKRGVMQELLSGRTRLA